MEYKEKPIFFPPLIIFELLVRFVVYLYEIKRVGLFHHKSATNSLDAEFEGMQKMLAELPPWRPRQMLKYKLENHELNVINRNMNTIDSSMKFELQNIADVLEYDFMKINKVLKNIRERISLEQDNLIVSIRSDINCIEQNISEDRKQLVTLLGSEMNRQLRSLSDPTNCPTIYSVIDKKLDEVLLKLRYG